MGRNVYVYEDGAVNPAEWHEYVYDNAALPVGNGNRTEYVKHVDTDADALHPIAELNGDGETESVFVYGSKINVPDYLMKPAGGGWEQYLSSSSNKAGELLGPRKKQWGANTVAKIIAKNDMLGCEARWGAEGKGKPY